MPLARNILIVVGVAHKRLPCGTEVAITYRGRSVTVPVLSTAIPLPMSIPDPPR